MGDKQFYNGSNLPGARYLEFKFTVDAANPPVFAPSPQNIYFASVVRVSQGIFRLTLADSYRFHSSTNAELNVPGTGVQRWAQPGPVANFGTALAPTVDILIVDNANAVQDPPAAGAQNFVSGTIVVGDVGAV